MASELLVELTKIERDLAELVARFMKLQATVERRERRDAPRPPAAAPPRAPPPEPLKGYQ